MPTLRLFTEFFESVPFFLPGIIVWALLSFALTPAAARVLESRRTVVFFVLLSFGAVVLATLTPTADFVAGPEPGAGCDLGRLGLPPLSELTTVNDTLRNVLLFVPLGFTLGLLERSRASLTLVLLAYLLPVAIEASQLMVAPLRRGCQSADVIDNAIGLTVGLAAALIIGQLATRVGRSRTWLVPPRT